LVDTRSLKNRKARVRGRAALNVLQFRSASPNAESQPAIAIGLTDRFWQMVDVVDVFDAFEAKCKRAAKPVFEVAQWAVGGGYYVRATLTDGTVDRIEGFAKEGEAGRGSRTSQSFGSAREIKQTKQFSQKGSC
jgi:hypothetical protein